MILSCEVLKKCGFMKVISTNYSRTVKISIIVFALSLLLLFLLKGKEYFFGGLLITAIYFLNCFFSKNVAFIEVGNELITFKYYFFGIIKKGVTYEISSLYTEVKRIVAFKGGVDFHIKFYTKSHRKKIFEISMRDFKIKEDFEFLDNLFKTSARLLFILFFVNSA